MTLQSHVPKHFAWVDGWTSDWDAHLGTRERGPLTAQAEILQVINLWNILKDNRESSYFKKELCEILTVSCCFILVKENLGKQEKHVIRSSYSENIWTRQAS